MGQISVSGVVKGGLAAALIMNISQTILNVPVAGAQMEAELAAHNLPAVGGPAIAVFVLETSVLGLITVWLYAAIRPRFGPGPKTAIIAGVVVWALTYLYSAIAFGVLGVNSMGIVVLGVVWGLVEMIFASAVGGYLYSE
jgi:hypothetical protein